MCWRRVLFAFRFSLSSGCIDACYAVCRDANYEQNGIKTQTYSGASLSDTSCANFFKFKSFNNSTTARGALRYGWEVNSVKHPQYSADVLDAAHDLTMISDQLGSDGRGNMITGLPDFNDGKCIFPLILNLPSAGGVAVKSGYNSKGNNSQFNFSVTGQTQEVANADSQVTAALSTYVLVETTATAMIAARSVAMSY